MEDVEDVREYADPGVKKLAILRLLDWLKKFKTAKARRKLSLTVRVLV